MSAALEAQIAALTAQVERLADEVGRLAGRELAAAAIYQSGRDDAGSVGFARQARRGGRTTRPRHGHLAVLALVPSGE